MHPAAQWVMTTPGSSWPSAPATVVRPVRYISACEYDRCVGAQFVPGAAGMALPVDDVKHGDEPPGTSAVFGLFVAAQPQIERAANKAAHVRVVM